MRYLGSLSPSSLSRRKSTTWRVPFLGFATFSSVFPRDENLSASFSGERAIRWQPRTSLNPNLLCQKLERSREREREKGRKQRLCWRSLPTEKEAGEGPGHSANFLSVQLLFFSFLFLLLLFAFSPTHRRGDRPDFNFRSLWRGERPPRTTRLFRNTWKLSIGNNAGILYWQERAPATTRTTTFVEKRLENVQTTRPIVRFSACKDETRTNLSGIIATNREPYGTKGTRPFVSTIID